MRTTVTKRGQVSIPSEIRKKLQIGPDTKLEWVVEGTTARVIPLPFDAKSVSGIGEKGHGENPVAREKAGPAARRCLLITPLFSTPLRCLLFQ
jgi:AbrB family looped-hinge helix DNA binding protein